MANNTLKLLQGQDSDFTWIAEDNSEIKMDAQTMFDFGKAYSSYESSLIFYARSLKDTVNNAQSQEELDTIDIETGWPT